MTAPHDHLRSADKRLKVESRDACRAVGPTRSGSVVILLQLMANGTDADHLATDLKGCDEPGAPKGNDQLTLRVIQGAGGPAA